MKHYLKTIDQYGYSDWFHIVACSLYMIFFLLLAYYWIKNVWDKDDFNPFIQILGSVFIISILSFVISLFLFLIFNFLPKT